MEQIKTLTLHLDEGCNPVTIVFDHIVAFADMGKFTEVFTTGGMSFEVIETAKYIEKLIEQIAEDTLKGNGITSYKKSYPSWYFKTVEEVFPHLSVRAAGCIRNADISTVGKLVQMSEDDLAETRCFGKKTLSEIKDALAEKNLALGMDDMAIMDALLNEPEEAEK